MNRRSRLVGRVAAHLIMDLGEWLADVGSRVYQRGRAMYGPSAYDTPVGIDPETGDILFEPQEGMMRSGSFRGLTVGMGDRP